MSITTMNSAQMMILESFASVKSDEELSDLVNVLRMFYANRLDAEMERLWNEGKLNQSVLNDMRSEHFRTQYH